MLDNWMKHTVNVLRPTATKGNSGGEIDTYSTVYTALACFIQPISTQWMIQYSQRQINVTHSITTNRNPTILNGDKITYGSRTFLVKGMRNIQESTKQLVIDVQEIV